MFLMTLLMPSCRNDVWLHMEWDNHAFTRPLQYTTSRIYVSSGSGPKTTQANKTPYLKGWRVLKAMDHVPATLEYVTFFAIFRFNLPGTGA
ncbi:hypothetical protein PPYC1_09270 [Paenibacillus polymyxa]|nr:hypothetical protein PPYC1_09270 [Paenibacillus polymyxa]OMF46615.1 hypothetical protein BK135_12350 [Paenibacillus peoriae]